MTALDLPAIRGLLERGAHDTELILAAPSIVAQLLAVVERVEVVLSALDNEIANSEAGELNAAGANLGAQLMACQSETFAYKQVRRRLRAAITGEGA